MSVRTRILNAIVAAIEDISEVGVVVRPGLTPEDMAGVITEQITAGKCAVEMMVGHDDPEGDASDTFRVMRWEMPVGLAIHLPSPLPNRPSSDEQYTADEYASLLHRAVYLLYMGPTTQPGRWPDAGGDTARHSFPLGGGGVYVDDVFGTNVTEHAFMVHYAHQATDPDTTA